MSYHSLTLSHQYPYPEPLYTGWSSVHWNAIGWPSVHTDRGRSSEYTGTPLEKVSWNCPTLEYHWGNSDYCNLYLNTTGGAVTAHTHRHILLIRKAFISVWNDKYFTSSGIVIHYCIYCIYDYWYFFSLLHKLHLVKGYFVLTTEFGFIGFVKTLVHCRQFATNGNKLWSYHSFALSHRCIDRSLQIMAINYGVTAVSN